MQFILSPTKQISLEHRDDLPSRPPTFLHDTQAIHQQLCTFSETDLEKIYKISPKLAKETVQTLKTWNADFNTSTGQAILSYQGAVFQKMDARSFTADELHYADQHLHILSAFYGVLSPLDRLKPYRLDMKAKVKIEEIGLYPYWKEKVTQHLKEKLEKDPDQAVLVNLASDEFYKMIDLKQLGFPVLSITFKEKKGETYKVIGMPSKQARGWMCQFIIKHQLSDIEGIKDFSMEGYHYHPQLSSDQEWVFTRP